MLAYLKCPFLDLFLKCGLNEMANGFPLGCSSQDLLSFGSGWDPKGLAYIIIATSSEFKEFEFIGGFQLSRYLGFFSV